MPALREFYFYAPSITLSSFIHTRNSTGIGPEAFGFFSSDGNFTGSNPSASDIAFYNKNGFFLLPGATEYILRPEVLESNFYAWRVTGDTKFFDRAVSAVASFNKFLPAPVVFAGINNVNDPNLGLIDDMESFWFAEVLKYVYVTSNIMSYHHEHKILTILRNT